MFEDITFDVVFWTLLPIVAWFLMGKDVYKEWYNKKYNIKEEIEFIDEKPSRFKLWQMWKDSYIYLVFVKRNNRIASQLVYVVALIPFSVIIIIIIEISTPIIPLNDLQTDEGVASVYINTTRRGTGDKLILYKGENNETENIYNISSSKSTKKQIDGKKIKIWYQHQWRLFWFENRVKRIEYNGKIFIKIPNNSVVYDPSYQNFGYDYSYQGKRINFNWNSLPELVNMLIILSILLLWIFFLNYKEKPIHRLNRINDRKKLK